MSVSSVMSRIATLPGRWGAISRSLAAKAHKTLPTGAASVIVGRAEEPKPPRKLGSRVATLVTKFSEPAASLSRPKSTIITKSAVEKARSAFEQRIRKEFEESHFWLSPSRQEKLANAGSWGIEELETNEERQARIFKEELPFGNVEMGRILLRQELQAACRELEAITETSSSKNHKNRLSDPEIEDMEGLLREEEEEFPEERSETFRIDPRTYRLMQKMEQAHKEWKEQHAAAEASARRLREAEKSKPNEGANNRQELRNLVQEMKGNAGSPEQSEAQSVPQKWKPKPGGLGRIGKKKKGRTDVPLLQAEQPAVLPAPQANVVGSQTQQPKTEWKPKPGGLGRIGKKKKAEAS